MAILLLEIISSCPGNLMIIVFILLNREWWRQSHLFQVIARIVDGSKFDEFKALYGDSLVTGKTEDKALYVPWCNEDRWWWWWRLKCSVMQQNIQCKQVMQILLSVLVTAHQIFAQNLTPNSFSYQVVNHCTIPRAKYCQFSCDSQIPKLKITFHSEVLVSSDNRLYRNLTFYGSVQNEDPLI